MVDSVIIQALATVVVATIGGVAAILVAWIQSSSKSRTDEHGILLPPDVLRKQKSIEGNTSQLVPWIITFTVIGGVIGFVVGGVINKPPASTPTPIFTTQKSPTAVSATSVSPTLVAIATPQTATPVSIMPTQTYTVQPVSPRLNPTVTAMTKDTVEELIKARTCLQAIETISDFEDRYKIVDLASANADLAKLKNDAFACSYISSGDTLITQAMTKSPADIILIDNARKQYLLAADRSQDNDIKTEAKTKADLAFWWISGNNSWKEPPLALQFFEKIQQNDKWKLFSQADAIVAYLRQALGTPAK